MHDNPSAILLHSFILSALVSTPTSWMQASERSSTRDNPARLIVQRGSYISSSKPEQTRPNGSPPFARKRPLIDISQRPITLRRLSSTTMAAPTPIPQEQLPAVIPNPDPHRVWGAGMFVRGRGTERYPAGKSWSEKDVKSLLGWSDQQLAAFNQDMTTAWIHAYPRDGDEPPSKRSVASTVLAPLLRKWGDAFNIDPNDRLFFDLAYDILKPKITKRSGPFANRPPRPDPAIREDSDTEDPHERSPTPSRRRRLKKAQVAEPTRQRHAGSSTILSGTARPLPFRPSPAPSEVASSPLAALNTAFLHFERDPPCADGKCNVPLHSIQDPPDAPMISVQRASLERLRTVLAEEIGFRRETDTIAYHRPGDSFFHENPVKSTISLQACLNRALAQDPSGSDPARFTIRTSVKPRTPQETARAEVFDGGRDEGRQRVQDHASHLDKGSGSGSNIDSGGGISSGSGTSRNIDMSGNTDKSIGISSSSSSGGGGGTTQGAVLHGDDDSGFLPFASSTIQRRRQGQTDGTQPGAFGGGGKSVDTPPFGAPNSPNPPSGAAIEFRAPSTPSGFSSYSYVEPSRLLLYPEREETLWASQTYSAERHDSEDDFSNLFDPDGQQGKLPSQPIFQPSREEIEQARDNAKQDRTPAHGQPLEREERDVQDELASRAVGHDEETLAFTMPPLCMITEAATAPPPPQAERGTTTSQEDDAAAEAVLNAMSSGARDDEVNDLEKRFEALKGRWAEVEHMTFEKWTLMNDFFKRDPDDYTSRIVIAGLGFHLYLHQALLVVHLLEVCGRLSGNIIGDEQGLGKTIMVITFAYLSCQVLYNQEQVAEERAAGPPKRHLAEGAPPGTVCPSASRISFRCSCEPGSVTATFKIQKGPTLIISPLLALSVWTREIHAAVTAHNRDWSLILAHDNTNVADVPSARKLASYANRELVKTKRNAEQHTTGQTRIFVLTTPGCLKTVVEKHCEKRLKPGIIAIDECHLIRGRLTAFHRAVADLLKDAKSYLLALSGTPFERGPKDLLGVIGHFITLWSSKLTPEERGKLVTNEQMIEWQKKIDGPWAKITKRKSVTRAEKDALIVALDSFRKALGSLMIRRTGESVLPSGKAMLTLPHLDTRKVDVPVPDHCVDVLNRYVELVKARLTQQHRNMVSSWERRSAAYQRNHPKPTFPSAELERQQYTARPICSFPHLQVMIEDKVLDASFTLQAIGEKGWLDESKRAENPFLLHLDKLYKSSTKLQYIEEQIDNTMNAYKVAVARRRSSSNSNSNGQQPPPQKPKFVIMTSYPICALIIFHHFDTRWRRACKKLSRKASPPPPASHLLRPGYMLSVMTPTERKRVVDAFQEPEPDKQYPDAIDIFISTTGVAGVAITLHRASNIFLLELQWRADVQQQAIKRIHRINQTMPCTAHLLWSSNAQLEAILFEKHKLLDFIHEICSRKGDGKHGTEKRDFIDLTDDQDHHGPDGRAVKRIKS